MDREIRNARSIYIEKRDWRECKKILHIDQDGNVREYYEDSKPGDGSPKAHGGHWYKKPVGIVILAVTGGLILFAITRLILHFYAI